jgi:tetratricopeptide (TPR) repeat protein
MYSMYAGDFKTAVAEGSRVLKENPSFEYALIPIAVSSLAAGDVKGARDAYDRLAKLSPTGQSLAALGLADLEMYLGRHKAALGILRTGIAADEKRDSTGETAQKYVALSEALLALGQRRQAVQAAVKATSLSRHESVLFPAARALLLSGDVEQPEQIAASLENMLQRHTTAYGRTILGELAVRKGRLAGGIEMFRDAETRRDTWFVRFLLGKTYAEAGHYAEALSELELCIKRRGEATDTFIYDTPTLRYLPPAYYWLGRAQEGLGAKAEAQKNYGEFLKLRAEADSPDPLAVDARKRHAALQ